MRWPRGASMTKISSLAVAILLGLCLLVSPAQAQLARTFVSSLGNDANDCGRLTPCRTFQIAHNNTLPAGEITVLDPGGYGAVTITKGISIINDGVGEAGALVSGGLNGITINAGANDRITLRGITVKGIGFGGGNGIVFQSGRFLSIENCVVRNLTGTAQNQFIGYGIIFNPNSASELVVSNTVVTDNEGHGISVVPNPNFVVNGARVTFSPSRSTKMVSTASSWRAIPTVLSRGPPTTPYPPITDSLGSASKGTA